MRHYRTWATDSVVTTPCIRHTIYCDTVMTNPVLEQSMAGQDISLIGKQQCHNSKCMIFQERLLKVLKCYDLLWVQRRHNCSPVASFANCAITLYPLKAYLQTFLSTPITQKYQILSCVTLLSQISNVCSPKRPGGYGAQWVPGLQQLEHGNGH
jgi:hypothetical protein